MPIACVRICKFPKTAAYNHGETNCVRVNDRVERKIKLLSGSERHRLAIQNHIEQRQHTHGALFFFRFNFALRFGVLLPRLPLRLSLVCGSGGDLRSRLGGNAGGLL